jgi:hypothetical protein
MNVIFFLLLFVAIIFLIIGLISPKASLFWFKRKTRKFSSLIYGVSAIVLIVLVSITAPKTVTAAPTIATTKSSSSASSNKAPVISKIDFSTATPTSENIKNAISDADIKSKVTDIKIDGGTVTVAINYKDALSLNSFLQQNQSKSAGVFKDLFKNKNIVTVIYQADIPVTDAYGKSTIVTGQTNTMQRADAEKVADWNTFAYESMPQYYSVVDFNLALESQVSGIHKSWLAVYK